MSVVEKGISPSAIAGYNILLNRELKARQKDPLWCIGIPTIPEIPPGMIGILLSYWRTLTDNKTSGGDLSRRLTIRRVQWMARLWPYFENVWKSKYSQEYQGKKAGTPEYDELKIGVLSRLADVYAERKGISEETGQTFNTRDLDEHFFVRGDLTVRYTLPAHFQQQLEDLKNGPAWKYIDTLKKERSQKPGKKQRKKKKMNSLRLCIGGKKYEVQLRSENSNCPQIQSDRHHKRMPSFRFCKSVPTSPLSLSCFSALVHK